VETRAGAGPEGVDIVLDFASVLRSVVRADVGSKGAQVLANGSSLQDEVWDRVKLELAGASLGVVELTQPRGGPQTDLADHGAVASWVKDGEIERAVVALNDAGGDLVSRVDRTAEANIVPAVFEPSGAEDLERGGNGPAVDGGAGDDRGLEAEAAGALIAVDDVGDVHVVGVVEEGGGAGLDGAAVSSHGGSVRNSVRGEV
jgi:hypothetical protein